MEIVEGCGLSGPPRLEREQADEQRDYERNLAWRATWEAENGRKLGGRKPKPPDRDALARRKINTTDPDTRSLTRSGRRAVQGYNAQVVATPEQVIVAADITQQANDSGQLAPMVDQAAAALREAGVSESIGTVLADGGYWNSPQISQVRAQGIDVIVPIENKRRTAPRTLGARQGPEAERIEAVLSKPEGQALYRRRQQIVEPAEPARPRILNRARRRSISVGGTRPSGAFARQPPEQGSLRSG